MGQSVKVFIRDNTFITAVLHYVLDLEGVLGR